MKYCANCGHEVSEENLFCGNCGSKWIYPEEHNKKTDFVIAPNENAQEETQSKQKAAKINNGCFDGCDFLDYGCLGCDAFDFGCGGCDFWDGCCLGSCLGCWLFN